MIEHLSERIIKDQYGYAYASSAPSSQDLVDKINELVDEVNKLKTKLEKENDETNE
jgi:hypothetical protein